jgi:adhesin HecA-like repeat protein
MCLLGTGAVLAGPAAAASCTDEWTGATSSDWTTASNWSTGALPTASDYVCVAGDAANPIDIGFGEYAFVAGITTPSSVPVDVALGGTLDVYSGGGSIGELTNNGWFEESGGTVAISDLTNLDDSGVLTGGGTFKVDQGGSMELPRSLTQIGKTGDTTTMVVAGSNASDGTPAEFTVGATSVDALEALQSNYGIVYVSKSVSLSGALTNSGTIGVDQGTLSVSSITNSGDISVDGALAANAVTNTGVLQTLGGTLQVAALDNTNGILSTNQSAWSLSKLTNTDGSFTVDGTDITGTTVTNVDANGAFTGGGTYDLKDGATLTVQTDITSIGASGSSDNPTITLGGSSSTNSAAESEIQDTNGDNALDTLTSNYGTLDLDESLGLTGALLNAGTLTIDGFAAPDALTADSVTNTGTLSATEGAAFQIASLDNVSGSVSTDQTAGWTLATLTNAGGSLDITGTTVTVGDLTNLDGSGVLTGGGAYDLESGATLTVQADVTSIGNPKAASEPTLTIGSTSLYGGVAAELKDPGGGDALSSLVANYGALHLQQSLSLTGASFLNVGSLTVDVIGATLTATSITNPGSVYSRGALEIGTVDNTNGTLTAHQSVAWSISQLTNTNGSFDVGMTAITISDLTNLDSDGVLTGGGSYTIDEGGTLTLPYDITAIGTSGSSSNPSVTIGSSSAGEPATAIDEPSGVNALADLTANYGSLTTYEPLALALTTNAGNVVAYAPLELTASTVLADAGSIDLSQAGTSTASGPIVVSSGHSLHIEQATLDDHSFTFSNAGEVQLGPSATLSVGSFTQTGGATELAGGNLDSGSSVVIDAGSELYGPGDVSGSISGAGSVEADYLGLPQRSGLLAVTGDYDNSGRTLEIGVGYNTMSTSQYGELTSTGTVSLGGTLELPYIGIASCPPDGTAITIVQAAGGVVGKFTTINEPPPNGAQCRFAVSYTADSVVATVGAVTAPYNLSAPTISPSSSLTVGDELTCATGSWTPSPTQYSYGWQRDGSPITDADQQTYTVQPSDQGHALACVVTAANGTATSDPEQSATVAVPAATVPPPNPEPAAPVVSSISPDHGAAGGGSTIEIIGAHLSEATSVTFGTTPARAFRVINDQEIVATSPAGNGVVDVHVTSSGGTNPASASNAFTYVAAVIVRPAVARTVNNLLDTAIHVISHLDPDRALRDGKVVFQTDVRALGNLKLVIIASPIGRTGRTPARHTVLAIAAVSAEHTGNVTITLRLTTAGRNAVRRLNRTIGVQLVASLTGRHALAYTATHTTTLRVRPRHSST